MTDDNLTLVPSYRFQWDDGTTRETTDPDFASAPQEYPDAIEYLAALGREDDECEVELIGMSA